MVVPFRLVTHTRSALGALGCHPVMSNTLTTLIVSGYYRLDFSNPKEFRNKLVVSNGIETSENQRYRTGAIYQHLERKL